MWFPAVLALILVQSCIAQDVENEAQEAQGFQSYAHANAEARIFNGKDASPHAIPSIAFIQVKQGGKVFNCAGSLVANQFVLTSARCLAGPGAKVQKVFLGANKFDRSDAAQVLTASKFLVNQQFQKDQSAAHDVALIKLSAPAKIQKGVVEVAKLAPAAAFPNKKDQFVGKQPIVFGWGRISQKSEKVPLVLQALQGKVVAFSALKNEKAASQNVLYLGQLDNNKWGVTWFGDSGAPLLLDGMLVGVASGEAANAQAWQNSQFASFARVDYNRAWVENNVNQFSVW